MTDLTLPGERFRIYKDPTFSFTPETHVSMLQGKILWSITGALKQAGLIKTDFYTQAGRIRGQYVHAACHYLDENDLDWARLDETIAGYVRAWEAFKRDWNFKPRLIELPMYSEALMLAGIPDREGLILNGDPAIVEIKTGTMMGWTAYQTAGQDLLIKEWDNIPTYRRRFGVALREDGTYQKPVEFTDINRFPNPEYHYDVMRAAVMVAQAVGGVDRGVPPLEFAE